MDIAEGHADSVEVSNELAVFAATVTIPLLFALIIPCCRKEKLLGRRTSLNCNTLFYKSSLASFWSKAYILVLLLQRLAFAAIIFGIEDNVIQICVMVLCNLVISQLIFKID